MTRLELLKIIIGQAHNNGFDFRNWYGSRLGLPWINAEAAFAVLETHRRYYALLFSHEFASTFWKPGSVITFQVPSQTFQRTMPNGSVATVTRKAFTRRSARKNVWRYHLREMAVSEDPLRYIRKYLRVEGELEEMGDCAQAASRRARSSAKTAVTSGRATKSKPAAKRVPRPLPADLPAFLRRPYP